MANKNCNNYAFIDEQNVYMSIRSQGWKLDHRRFRAYLREKYHVTRAYVFFGYRSDMESIYRDYREAGFECVFKPTLMSRDGTVKGNCDAELVLQVMIDLGSYDEAVLVSGDGDFYCVLQYLQKRQQLLVLLLPNQSRYSALYRRRWLRPYPRFMNELQDKIGYKKERPHKDGTL